MQNYLNNIVIPFYTAQAHGKNNFILFDLNLKVLLASVGVLNRLSYNGQKDIIGKTYTDFNHLKPEYIPKLISIFKQCIKNKQTINFITLGGQIRPKYKNHHELIFQSYKPIFDNKQNVVAIVASKIPTINTNLFHIFFPKFQTQLENSGTITEKLAQREFEVFYLLSNGLSQYEIAKQLSISRNTVVKTISERILPKLALNDNKELIKIAIALSIHGKVPKSLVDEQLIIIDSKADE
jgi:DNA-binding CsgD family transcriptional regulator